MNVALSIGLAWGSFMDDLAVDNRQTDFGIEDFG